MTTRYYMVSVEYDTDDGTAELDRLMAAAMEGLNESLPTTRELHISAWATTTPRDLSQIGSTVASIDYVPEVQR